MRITKSVTAKKDVKPAGNKFQDILDKIDSACEAVEFAINKSDESSLKQRLADLLVIRSEIEAAGK